MNRLKEIREKSGLGQKVVAAEVGVSQPTISAWENGTKTPTLENLKALSRLYDVSLDYLVGGGTEKTPTPEGERQIDDEDIKVALFGGDGDITDEMWEEAKFAIELIKARKRREQGKE